MLYIPPGIQVLTGRSGPIACPHMAHHTNLFPIKELEKFRNAGTTVPYQLKWDFHSKNLVSELLEGRGVLSCLL